MKLDKSSMLVYAITDRAWLGEDSLPRQVEQSIQGGATLVQLREKNLALHAFLKLAQEIKQLPAAMVSP